MEQVEFFVSPEGKVYFDQGNGYEPFKQDDREIIAFILFKLHEFYQPTFDKLAELYAKSKPNKWYFEYKIASRFIRCNFGDLDKLTFDINFGALNFEEVRCPLRGICDYEGIICKPKLTIAINPEEKKVAKLYAKGSTISDIAMTLQKSVCTVDNQINNVRIKLGLNSCREIIKYFNTNNLTF